LELAVISNIDRNSAVDQEVDVLASNGSGNVQCEANKGIALDFPRIVTHSVSSVSKKMSHSIEFHNLTFQSN
jgi:hypothetical protein